MFHTHNPSIWKYIPEEHELALITPSKVPQGKFNLARTLLAKDKEKIVFIDGDTLITYGQLDSRSNKVAQMLVNYSKPSSGDRILINLPNGLPFIECWLAVLKIGCVAVSVSQKIENLKYYLEDTKAKVLITTYEDTPLPVIDGLDFITFFVFGQKKANIQANELVKHYEQEVERQLDESIDIVTTSDTAGSINYTSGSTGFPKGCVHTHAALADQGFGLGDGIWTENDKFMTSASFAYLYGLGMGVIFPMLYGAQSILLNGADPLSTFSQIEEKQPTIFAGNPRFWTGFITELEAIISTKNYDFSFLRMCYTAGEKMPISLHSKWGNLFPSIPMLDTVGSSELLHFLSNTPSQTKSGSAGLPLPGYDIQLLDEDFNIITTTEAEGILAVRAPTRCCYWNSREKQSFYVKNGWNIPGDYFRRDSDGFFWYIGRKDHLIITKCGENLSAVSLEETLRLNSNVVDAAVVLKPGNDDSLNLVKCFLVTTNDVWKSDPPLLEKQISDFLWKELASKFDLVVKLLAEIPKCDRGKVNRKALLEL